jgi:hypothetical protein
MIESRHLGTSQVFLRLAKKLCSKRQTHFNTFQETFKLRKGKQRNQKLLQEKKTKASF